MQEKKRENNNTTPSPVRRQLLTGLAGASAVVALAPTQWSKPVLNRLVTPAHGQAVSIAAGTYRAVARFIELISDGFGDFEDCEVEVIFEFQWPGGTGPSAITGEPIQVNADCGSTGVPGLIEDTQPGTATLIVTNGPESAPGLVLEDVAPPLPTGLFFVATEIDYTIPLPG